MKTLTHITDVGAPFGAGTDSNERIRQQYNALGAESRVVNAGQSPLHVAFTACTCLARQARDNAGKLLKLLNITPDLLPPTALNSAPRNSAESRPDGKENYIFRVRYNGADQETLLIYGPEVLRWVLAFRGRVGATVEKIRAVTGVIPDTSRGSQFRSAEHLPLVHFLEARGVLDKNSERSPVEIGSIPDYLPKKNAVVLPPDEYGNGRLLIQSELYQTILGQKGKVSIEGIGAFHVKPSLTEVSPGELSVWPSSNHFPDDSLHVLNIGTRWAEGSTQTTDMNVLELSTRLAGEVGRNYSIEI